ncbi:MAG: DVUA0089 family protein [Verrucomicrobia bacterium]|nr:DVUA0089 family protein [Verrucomicrobiota bacterium]
MKTQSQPTKTGYWVARIVIAMLVLLCGSKPFAAEVEPNDNRQQANLLNLSPGGAAIMSGRVSPLKDLDFYSISIPALAGPGTLVVTMTPTGSDHELDARVQLLNASGAVLVDKDDGSDNRAETLSYSSVAANSIYFVVCRSADLFIAGSGEYDLRVELLQPRPNLVWYQPSGWSDKLVVSKTVGTSMDGSNLTTTNILFLDLALANIGALATAGPFSLDLMLDGTVIKSWFVNQSVAVGGILGVTDYPLGPLAAGNHTLKLVLDPAGSIGESIETDNEFSKSILVVDDDPDDQLAGAPDLGQVLRTLTRSGTVSSPTDVNLVSFTVASGQRLSFDLDDAEGWDPYLRLFDSKGVELASNNDGPGPGEEPTLESYIEYTFAVGGTYFVGVSGAGNRNYDPITGKGDTSGSTGGYKLVISPGLAGMITPPGSQVGKLVDVLRFGVPPMRISVTQQTWVVIHGWTSSRDAENISDLTSALAQAQPEDQVLTLDWSQAADLLVGPFSAESAIIPVAQWAAAALTHAGFHGASLNLVGHSFGSYVADEIAKRIPGGVHTIVTLDPAADVPGGFNPTANDEIDFNRDSFFSWSFHSSSAGNEFTPATADEAFIVESGLNTLSAHGNVVFLFAYMILHPDEMISHFFRLSALLTGTPGPWVPDQFTSSFLLDAPVTGYEAKLTSKDSGKVPSLLQFVPLPSVSIFMTRDGLAVAWLASYTNFVLQSSPVAAPTASWVDVKATPVDIDQARAVLIDPSGAGRFFRLKQR